MKILLIYNSSSKVREIVDYDHLIEVIESTFQIEKSDFGLQIHDDDFNEYVDLEDFTSLKDKCKIKVNNLTQTYMIEKESSPQICLETQQALPFTEDVSVEVVLDLKSQWPDPVQLPIHNFSEMLREALQKEQDLNWKLSSELVEHLAIYAYNYNRYPNKAQRMDICQALIDNFKYLRNNIGLGVGGWEIKLLNRLKKMRQNDSSLEVKLNRMKRKSGDSIVPKNIKMKLIKGQVNWAPDHIEGEDETSQSMHRQIMLEESRKKLSFQDKKKIKSLMNLTYSFRRISINNIITVKEIKDLYPIFFQIEDQFDEFERLTSVNVRDTFFKEVAVHSFKLFNLFRASTSSSLRSIQKDIDLHVQSNEEEINEDIKTALGLYILPCLLKESFNDFLEIVPSDKEGEFSSISPKIFATGCVTSCNFSIMAENELIIQNVDLITAVGLLVSFFYTLNIAYPKEISSTLKFIQHYFFKINDGTVTSKVSNLFCKMIAFK